MLPFTEATFPARQLFACSNKYSTNKELLSQRRQEEACNAVRSSTERLQKIYNFNLEYSMPNDSSQLSLLSNQSIQLERILPHSSKISSASKISTEESKDENSPSCDMWRWEIIDTKSQYIPSFYLRKQYHSDGCIAMNKYANSYLPQMPIKQIWCTENTQVVAESNIHQSLLLEDKDLMNKSSGSKCTPSKINSWNVPIRKWSPSVDKRYSKHIPPNGHSEVCRLLFNSNATTDPANVLNVRKSPFVSEKSLASRGFDSWNIKYRQLTILEMLPKWHEQANRLHLRQQIL